MFDLRVSMMENLPETAMPDDFPYSLTVHAAMVIAERGIALEWVVRVLASPQVTEIDKHDPELRHALATIPERGSRALRVIYNETSEPWRIVTAFFDRKRKGKL